MDNDIDPEVYQPGFANIVNGNVVEFMIWCSPDTPLGHAYRLDMTVVVRDCNGRKAKIRQCVFINVQAC